MDLEQEVEPGAGASPREDRCCNPLRAELLDQDRCIGANINPLRLEIHLDLGLRREGRFWLRMLAATGTALASLLRILHSCLIATRRD